jgi:hypothetical protein
MDFLKYLTVEQVLFALCFTGAFVIGALSWIICGDDLTRGATIE